MNKVGLGGTMAQWCITPCCRNQKWEPTPMMAADVDKASWTVSTVYSSEQVVRYYLASLFMAKTAFQKQLLMNTFFALKIILCSQQADRIPFDEHWPPSRYVYYSFLDAVASLAPTYPSEVGWLVKVTGFRSALLLLVSRGHMIQNMPPKI